MLRVIHGFLVLSESLGSIYTPCVPNIGQHNGMHTNRHTLLPILTFYPESPIAPDLFRAVSVRQERENRSGGGGDWAAGRPKEEVSHQVVHHTQRHQPSVERGAFCF